VSEGPTQSQALGTGTSTLELLPKGPHKKSKGLPKDRATGPSSPGSCDGDLVMGHVSRGPCHVVLVTATVSQGPCRKDVHRVPSLALVRGTLSQRPRYRGLFKRTFQNDLVTENSLREMCLRGPRQPQHRDLGIGTLPMRPCYSDLGTATFA